MIRYRPLTSWPWPETTDRRASLFKATDAETRDLLKYEVARRGAEEVLVELDVEKSAIRLDGGLIAGRTIYSARVVVTFEDPSHGWVRYHSDVFKRWKDNLRGIALSLEALRACERYGVATGEQYQGFATGLALPGQVLDSEEAAHIVSDYTDLFEAKHILGNQAAARAAVLDALKKVHPDQGGSRHEYEAIQACRDVLANHHGTEKL